MQSKTKPSRIHEGRNIKRFREMLGIKQEALAFELGDEWNQKKVSILEQRETVDDRVMKQVADVLKIPVEAFRNFDEEQAINIISNTFNQEAYIGNSGGTFHINPVDKLIQLHDEKIALYERMLKEKDEMMVRLEKIIESNK